MPPALHELIRTWAVAQGMQVTGQNSDEDRARMWLLESAGVRSKGDRARMWLLEGDHLVGEIRVLQVQDAPPSFYLEVMCGSMVLDESWANLKSLASCLTMALRLLQRRVKTAEPQWHLHLGDLPP